MYIVLGVRHSSQIFHLSALPKIHLSSIPDSSPINPGSSKVFIPNSSQMKILAVFLGFFNNLSWNLKLLTRQQLARIGNQVVMFQHMSTFRCLKSSWKGYGSKSDFVIFESLLDCFHIQ